MKLSFTGLVTLAALAICFPAAASAATVDGASSVSPWVFQAVPLPAAATNASLPAVSCTSATSCTAVGARYRRAGLRQQVRGAALAEHWDGSAWTIEPTPANPPGSNVSILDAASCTPAASCTAVGASLYVSSPTARTLAERWNGSTWTVQQTAFPPRHKVLKAVSCTSASTCTAVGGSSTADAPFNDRPVAEHE